MKTYLLLLMQFFLYAATANCQDTDGFEGLLVYSYNNYYESEADSLKEENKLQLFAEKTGYEIGKRKKGINRCYIKSDTLLIALYTDEQKIPNKHYVQMGNTAYVEDLITGSITTLSKSSMEELFDKELVENWRDSVSVNRILKRDLSNLKKTRKSEIINGMDCVKYKSIKNKNTFEFYWVNTSIKQGDIQKLPVHFESLFLDDGLIVKKEAFHKGRTVVHELQLIQQGSIEHIKNAINFSDITKVKIK